ncbi:MAG: MBL fold metallo-hydrolase [Oscillospiraceae bacterium]|jgi:phosphoribosyl 1,2-cyclic phosphodiesterase|nr:MBL fold metallo-hydrolase [Oscillospiraceae bacterium]
MRFTTLASSSSGNCVLLSHGERHILIDAGISSKRISSALSSLGLSLGDIGAVLVTHSHGDHVSGLPAFAERSGARVYATDETLDIIASDMPARCEMELISPGAGFSVPGFEARAFCVPHDAPGSVGFVVTASGRKFVLATDLGIVTPEVLKAAQGADAAVIEANHDAEMLRNGYYPPTIKRRIASGIGHLSNDACGGFAVKLAESGAGTLVLAHLSSGNNTPELALDAVGGALERGGIAAGRDVRLFAAPSFGVGDTYEV